MVKEFLEINEIHFDLFFEEYLLSVEIYMDILTDLSIKIAEATVPDEIELAPLMTEAFVSGEKEKESLFVRQESAGLGAFGLNEGI